MFIPILIASVLQWPTFAMAQWPPPLDPPSGAPLLPKLKTDLKQITISGISSGAYMAIQMQVAFSKTFSGAASIAGGVYGCSLGRLAKAIECMQKPEKIRSDFLLYRARIYEAEGVIDRLQNLKSAKLYIQASDKDAVVRSENAMRLKEFFSPFVPAHQITLHKTLASAHGFPTLSTGSPCDQGQLPWLLKCQFDTAGEILRTMYGQMNPRGQAKPGSLRKFSQREFGSSLTLAPEGWVYLPSACETGATCRLHVALHGCEMSPDFIQDQFVTMAGYNEWAETNQIVVLYPQSVKLKKTNPLACWDWVGFTGPSYATRHGPQMRAMKRMVDRLSLGK